MLTKMLEDPAIEHPELTKRKYPGAIRVGLALMSKRMAPFAFVIGAFVSVAVAIVIVVTAFTPQNASVVQALMFGVGPLLSYLAVVTALGATRASWPPVLLGAVGIVTACSAHMTWYAELETNSAAGTSRTWLALIVSAALLISGAAGALIWRHVSRVIPTLAAVSLSTLGGVVAGVLTVPVLVIPGTTLVLALAALVIVMVRHRNEHQNLKRRAAAAAQS
ncbi:MAG TPA: hypothetical protein H9830_15730 [Candidatus Agrococcus pullicola]|uniref:Uncharacterized protein n=1 Tax=Candidatus Agrococcus pullicola TaxID=2838429 RepID=A0A9D1YYM3_9MICO|nr:hypothetical protein [Candidatus Agrococcus pullicola]